MSIKRIAGSAVLLSLAVAAGSALAQQPAPQQTAPQLLPQSRAPAAGPAEAEGKATARIAEPDAMPRPADAAMASPTGATSAPMREPATGADGAAGKPATAAADDAGSAAVAGAAPAAASPAAARPEPAAAPSQSAATPTPADRNAATAAAAAASRAAAEKADREADEGIGDEARVVQPILAKHPDSNVIICVAGCGPQPSIVQVLPREQDTRTESEVVPSSGRLGGDNDNDSKAATKAQPETGDIVCLAGCLKKRGEVVHRKAKLSWLSPEEAERSKAMLRRVAERFGAEAFPVVDAVSRAADRFAQWSQVGRAVVQRGIKVAEQADE